MKIIDWLGNLFRPPEKAGIYHVDSYRAEAEDRIALEAYALFSVVHLIANLLSGCEFRTYRNGKELHGAEWASMNIRPNRNQNAAEWKSELISRLLITGDVLCIQLPDPVQHPRVWVALVPFLIKHLIRSQIADAFQKGRTPFRKLQRRVIRIALDRFKTLAGPELPVPFHFALPFFAIGLHCRQVPSGTGGFLTDGLRVRTLSAGGSAGQKDHHTSFPPKGTNIIPAFQALCISCFH